MRPPSTSELWLAVDERRAVNQPYDELTPPPGRRRFRWVVDASLPLTLTVLAGIAVMLPQTLPTEARLALFGFALATILWSTTTLNSAYVALVAVMVTVLSGGASQETLFNSLASDVIWLMIGAFVLGGAMRYSGLAERLTGTVVRRAKTVNGVFWMVTTVLLPLSFLIPSTSGRAAVVMPVFRDLADTLGDRKITRALALLMPTVILVATVSTLIGAASHLIATDLLRQVTGEGISFAQWAMWGVPFGLAASYLSCWVIMILFLDKEHRARSLLRRGRGHDRPGPLGRKEKCTLIILSVLVVGWLSESWHGVEIATMTMAGALLLTLPRLGVMRWKDALGSVSWNLILFVGAALALGRALIDSGAAQWIIDHLFAFADEGSRTSTLLILLFIGFLSLTSHLYITSHTVRAVALVPPFLYLASSLDLNATAVLFISIVGMDYCLTLPVSSKALVMFAETGSETFRPADLLRLSAVLLPAHMILIVIFYFGYWQWTGLAL